MWKKITFCLIGLLVSFFASSQNAHAVHNDSVVLGKTASGAWAFQVLHFNGVIGPAVFVLNDTFPKLDFFQNVRVGPGPGHERILVGGSGTIGATPNTHVFQVYERDGTKVGEAFALNGDFTGVRFGNRDLNGDGIDEIVVFGTETGGSARGPAFQVFDQSGTLVGGGFFLSGAFTEFMGCTGIQNLCSD